MKTMFLGVVLHSFLLVAVLKTSCAENTAIGDVGSICTKEELLRIRLSISHLSNSVLEQKNEICEIKTQISVAGKNDENTIDVKETNNAGLGNLNQQQLEEQISTQNKLLHEQAAEIDELRRGLAVVVERQVKQSLDIKETNNAGSGNLTQQQLEKQISTQNKSLYEQAAEIDELRRGLAIFVQQLNQSTGVICPIGFRFIRRTCYLFHEEKLTWSESINFCKIRGSSLVILESTLEFESLVLYMRTSGSIREYWTAATDADEEGVWKWVPDGSPAGSLPWGPNQPNSYGGDQDCVTFESDYSFSLNDVACSDRYRPLCKIN